MYPPRFCVWFIYTTFERPYNFIDLRPIHSVYRTVGYFTLKVGKYINDSLKWKLKFARFKIN